MKRFLKWIFALVGIVIVLLVIATVVLPMVIDPNNYKEEISDAVAKKTGRDLTIGGEIKWTVFPSIGLELSDVTRHYPRGWCGPHALLRDDPTCTLGLRRTHRPLRAAVARHTSSSE